ncbi:MAG: glycosyltransferase family 1 protein [Burkholderiaceae bacterium]
MNPTHTLGLLNDHLQVEHLPAARPSLRVGLVTETYPPEINGVALTLAKLVQALQARGHHIQLVRPRQVPDMPDAAEPASPPPLEQVLVRGLPIPKYPHLRMGLPAKKALIKLWTLHRPDLVHIATEGPLGWSALQAARKLKLPISTDFRTNFDAYSRHYGLSWLQKPIAAYLRKFHNLADCTMVPTAALQATLAANRFERLHVVARGVDVARFQPERRSPALRAHWGVADHGQVALYVGRLAPEKNLGLLARTFNAMKAAQPGLTLVVVGDGPGRAELQAACPQALLVGSQTGDALAAHYASADCFVFPSLTETYGNVTPEALASGLAVLAFDHAAASDLVRHGHNGLLAPAGDADAFVRQAVTLATTPALVHKLREQAPASVAARDWSHIASQVEGIWGGLLHRHPSAHQAALPHLGTPAT